YDSTSPHHVLLQLDDQRRASNRVVGHHPVDQVVPAERIASNLPVTQDHRARADVLGALPICRAPAGFTDRLEGRILALRSSAFASGSSLPPGLSGAQPFRALARAPATP